MAEKKWTLPQKNAIYSTGGSILVSAAAGSGKTAVLVERVLNILTNPTINCSAEELLIVTFTNAAANEMKARILNRFENLIQQEPNNIKLRKQQMLLDGAFIGTIHSFCNNLIKENFYKLNISANFKIAQPSEILILKQKAIDSVLEDLFKENSEKFLNLVDLFCNPNNDFPLIEIIFKLYDFSRSIPFFEKWQKEKIEFLDNKNNILIEYAFTKAKNYIQFAKTTLENSLDILKEEQDIAKIYLPTLYEDLEKILRLENLLEQNKFQPVFEFLKDFSFSRLKPYKLIEKNYAAEKFKKNRDKVKNLVEQTQEFFYCDETTVLDEMKTLKSYSSEIFRITSLFQIRLEKLKIEKNLLDFSDLEHLALKLLVNSYDTEKLEKTELAKSISEKFKHIMVDEYQDINPLQNLIFKTISQNEQNLFRVGDIKQSIYGFRNARPEIFINLKEDYNQINEKNLKFPAKIILEKNFRSNNKILTFVNFICEKLISKETCKIDYNSEETLVFGKENSKDKEENIEIKIIENKENQDINILESKYIAQFIKKQILEKNAKPQDFCILLRNANKHGKVFLKELENWGIPAECETQEPFFESFEISIIVSFLNIINNPIQDIPLIAILTSPIFGFNLEKIAQIRKINMQMPFYFALKEYAESGDKQSYEFLNFLEKLSYVSATMPISKFINYLYETTNFLAIIQAMPNGEKRALNLYLLEDYARNFENYSSNNMVGFLHFISNLKEKKVDLPSAKYSNKEQNCVKIISIHRAKGLEFSVCILANCSRDFVKENQDFLINEKYGIGFKILNNNKTSKNSPLIRKIINSENKKENIAEELRILYVALTRAKEKLIILNTLNNPIKKVENFLTLFQKGKTIHSLEVLNANNFSDWILPCLLQHTDGTPLREKAENKELQINFGENNDIFNIEFIEHFEKSILDEPKIEKNNKILLNTEVNKKIETQLNLEYPFMPLCKINSKFTVSEILQEENELKYAFAKRPKFFSKNSKLNAAEKGSALHIFLQFLDFNICTNDLEHEIERQIKLGILNQQQAKSLKRTSIEKFLNSDLINRIKNSNNVKREYKFSTYILAKDLYPNINSKYANEKIVLEGAIDCLFEEENKWIIVDYKTNKINDEKLTLNYKKQLELYKSSVEKCTNLEVKECVLYAFYKNKEIILQI